MFDRPMSLAARLVCVCFGSLLCSLVAYPEIYLTFKTSFLLFDDYLLEYFNTSIIAGFLAQGRIQLWDHFGQMPFAYLFTTLGTFKFPNVVAALAFYVLSPLSEHTGVLFHHVFAWANLFTLLFLRVIGIYLLVGRLIADRRIVASCAALGAVFYCQPAFFIGTFYQSFYPLVLYLIICFFETFQARYLAAVFAFFVISFSNSLIHSCYLYMGVHFFILSALAWSLIIERRRWIAFVLGLRDRLGQRLFAVVCLMAFAAVVVGPYVWMQKIGVADVEFGVKNSRLDKMFDINYYFHEARLTQADPQDFFRRMTDFTVDAGESFFCGFMLLALAVTGLVLGRESRKWIFAAAILCVYLINCPREGFNPGWPVHWINALTNPFKNIVRSYHMATLSVLPYFLIPLAAVGIQELLKTFKAGSNIPTLRLKTVLVATTAFAVGCVPHVPDIVRGYLVLVMGIWGGVLLALVLNRGRLWTTVVGFLLVFLLAMDVYLVVVQTRNMLKKYFNRRPYETVSLAAYGHLGVDYPNPLVFPVREYGASYFSYQDALIGPLVGQPQNYFKFTSFMLNFIPIDGHNPRHKAYASWVRDGQMLRYIQENNRLFFHAGYAVRESDALLAAIMDAGLARDAVMVEDPSGALTLPDRLSAAMTPLPHPARRWITAQGRLSKGRLLHDIDHPDLAVISLPLPADFPRHLATTFFTEDKFLMRLKVERPGDVPRECSAVQGEFVGGCAFDVQNYKEGRLTVAVARDEFDKDMTYAFAYSAADGEGLVRVRHREFDVLDFDYQAARDGWLVVQYPFDRKWRIHVDQRPVVFYRVNKSFIGFPLGRGEHRVEMRYEPDSLLRLWLLISVVFSTLGFIVLCGVAIRWESAYNRTASRG